MQETPLLETNLHQPRLTEGRAELYSDAAASEVAGNKGKVIYNGGVALGTGNGSRRGNKVKARVNVQENHERVQERGQSMVHTAREMGNEVLCRNMHPETGHFMHYAPRTTRTRQDGSE